MSCLINEIFHFCYIESRHSILLHVLMDGRSSCTFATLENLWCYACQLPFGSQVGLKSEKIRNRFGFNSGSIWNQFTVDSGSIRIDYGRNWFHSGKALCGWLVQGGYAFNSRSQIHWTTLIGPRPNFLGWKHWLVWAELAGVEGIAQSLLFLFSLPGECGNAKNWFQSFLD